MLSVALNHLHKITHTIGLRRALHAIMVLGNQTRLDDAGCHMPKLYLANKHRKTT